MKGCCEKITYVCDGCTSEECKAQGDAGCELKASVCTARPQVCIFGQAFFKANWIEKKPDANYTLERSELTSGQNQQASQASQLIQDSEIIADDQVREGGC